MKRVDLFRGMNDSQLELLSQICHESSFDAQQAIITQGETGDCMYIISAGQVEILVQDSDGATYSALYLGEGQVFGEMALLDEGKRSATIRATHDDTVVYSIPRDDFNALCEKNTGIGYIMMRNLAQDLSFKLRHHDFNPSGQ
jgi:CRP-like cAMP-binding protein